MATFFLATIIGWYLVIMSTLLLVRADCLKSAISDILAQRGLFFVLAMITLIFGLIMVTSHNIWVMGWPVVITILSWLVLISGLIRLFCAESIHKMAHSFVDHPSRIRILAAVLLILGLFLLFHVYYPIYY
ncbi:MAG: hypothetical protein ACHP65_07345 [Legionellales bacterium]